MEPYRVIDSKRVYEGITFNVRLDTMSLPDGNSAQRETVEHCGAAAIVPVDELGRVVLVRQYRHAAGAMTLEIPAGMLEPGEAPETCAARELEEETGLKAGRLKFITEIYTTVGFCDEKISIFAAAGLRPGFANPDPDEFVTVERYPLEEAVGMVLDGRITDGKTALGILAAAYSASTSHLRARVGVGCSST